MEYKRLEENDLALMTSFVDDENTRYDAEVLRVFIENDGAYGFIVKNADKIIGFATAYALLKADGRKVFYLDAIDIVTDYQGHGYGTKLMEFMCDYAKNIGCDEMFLITNRSNVAACKCYEKSGGVSESQDDIIYVYDLKDRLV